MNKFWVIAWDVYKKNIKSVSFIILLIMPFLAVGIFYAIGSFAENSTNVNKIAVYANEPTIAQSISDQSSSDYSFEVVGNREEGEKQLAAEEVDGVLLITVSGNTVKGELLSEDALGQSVELAIEQLLTGIQISIRSNQLGLSAEEVSSLGELAEFSKQKVTFDDAGSITYGEDYSDLQFIVGYVATIILFFFILTYAQIIAQEIASEKGTRIMEVILSSTKATTHYYAKLTGVILMAFTQLLVYAVAIAGSYFWIKDVPMVKVFLENISLSDLFGSFLIFSVVFVFLGILIYSVLSALCGSLVNKSEDTAKAIIPVTYLALAGYMLGMTLGAMDSNNIVIRVTSYVPFFSSFIMPVRLANDTVGVGGALISVAILIVSTIALMLVSAKMYKSNVLIYNENGLFTSLKQSLALMKNER